MTAAARPVRVRQKHVEWVRERLGDRDRAILATVHRLRLVQSSQLERLHFLDLPPSHRARTRRRVLRRLVDWRVLLPLERRIGGVRAGSAGLVYALDTAGCWLANLDARTRGDELAIRRPAEPSPALLAHTLGVAELYVQLREQERGGGFTLVKFMTEPGSWQPNGLGGWLKPDAYLAVATADLSDHWWVELDMATESLPTIRKKLTAYLDFVRRGQRGPQGVVPRVLVSVPTEKRRQAVAEIISQLPPPANRLMRIVTHEHAAPFIVEVLRE
jgi:hypothetical protein